MKRSRSPVQKNGGAASRCWNISELSRQVHRLTYENCHNGDEFWLLLQTDEHWDNAHCDLKLLARHHDEAVARNAPIFKFGDIFCAMQGKWDKRADQNQLRPEHRGGSYLDLLVNTAGKFYQRWDKNIALITPGNHEGSILQRHETNLTERLLVKLREKSAVPHMGSYGGFVQIQFRFGHKPITLTLNYHHGYGGGGEVTRGLIDNNRTRGQYLADIYIGGHIHRRNSDENIITYCSLFGTVKQQQQLFLRSSTYKDEADGNGWHTAQGRAARPKGGWWLKFTVRADGTGASGKRIDVTEMRAT